MKLKTLKDFEILDTLMAMKLRAEAIKWIKELKKVDIEYTPFDNKNKNELRKKVFENTFGIEIILDDEYDWQYAMRDFLVSFIKHFFNLTEEELK